MSDDAEQIQKAPTQTLPAPSPQMFARPGAPAPERAPGGQTGDRDHTDPGTTGDSARSRFASTGDPRVDRAVAQLPDPADHHRSGEQPTDGISEDSERFSGADRDENGGDEADAPTGIDLPDPALLDAHLAEVTSVHRQLQQRLSDLSG